MHHVAVVARSDEEKPIRILCKHCAWIHVLSPGEEDLSKYAVVISVNGACTAPGDHAQLSVEPDTALIPALASALKSTMMPRGDVLFRRGKLHDALVWFEQLFSALSDPKLHSPALLMPLCGRMASAYSGLCQHQRAAGLYAQQVKAATVLRKPMTEVRFLEGKRKDAMRQHKLQQEARQSKAPVKAMSDFVVQDAEKVVLQCVKQALGRSTHKEFKTVPSWASRTFSVCQRAGRVPKDAVLKRVVIDFMEPRVGVGGGVWEWTMCLVIGGDASVRNATVPSRSTFTLKQDAAVVFGNEGYVVQFLCVAED